MTKFERLFVWAGGAMFVMSLAACAYFYLVIWASPAAAGGWTAMRAATINTVLFAVFALHHSLFARESMKRRIARLVPEPLLRSFYVWTASALLLGVLALWQPV